MPIGVGPDQAAVDGKAFATHEALGDAAGEHSLEEASQEVAIAEAAMAVHGEGGMVRHPAIESEPAEPAVREVEVNLVAEPALGADVEAVADDQHPDHQLGIDRRAAR